MAEELVLGDISTGASNDLQTATSIARSMVMKYGMSDRLGAISYDSDQEVFIGRSMSQARAYSEEVAGLIDEEIKSILDTAYARCREILSQNMDALERTAQYLLEFETMSAEDFQLVFQPPEVLERRKAEERVQRTRQAEEKAAEQARLQAAREAEMVRRLQEADEAAQSKEDETPPPPQNPDPFERIDRPAFSPRAELGKCGAFFCRGSTVFPAPFPPLRHRLPWVPKIREENFDHV